MLSLIGNTQRVREREEVGRGEGAGDRLSVCLGGEGWESVRGDGGSLFIFIDWHKSSRSLAVSFFLSPSGFDT